MRNKLSQRQRAISLLIDMAVLLTVTLCAFGSIVPPLGDKGFWFYTALLSIIVGTKLVTPFYVKPVDAISYAIPAFVALMLTNHWSEWSLESKVSYAVSVSISVIAGGLALVAMLLNGWGIRSLQDLSSRLRIVVEQIATPAIIYAPIMIFSMFAFHYQSPSELVAVSIAMLLTTAFSIGDILIGVFSRLIRVFSSGTETEEFGQVAAYQKPGIYLLRTDDLAETDLPAKLVINDDLAGLRLAFATDIVGRENGHLCRAIDLGALNDPGVLSQVKSVQQNSSVQIADDLVEDASESTRSAWNSAERYVGFVSQETSVNRLYFEVTKDTGLSVGRLVSVEFGGQRVFYQLVAGLTREEAVHQKNTYGYVRAQAQQVGIWDGRKFSQCRWLPSMHAPVTLEESEEYQITEKSVGRFPHTNFQAEIGSVSSLVTHNTAILGILGVGKSMLAIELVERMMAEGIKVICLDLTNQYAVELSEYYCKESEDLSRKLIQDACKKDSDASSDNPEEGGSLPNLKEAIAADLTKFLSNENPQRLKIYNPSEFVATRQEYEPKSYQSQGKWFRSAGLYSVTPVEATQIISEAALACVSDSMSDKARVCLVYEEAHALVPEWNSVVSDGDKRATSGTARAILQGRKYGMGCLLITQRTANVTKTMLNQCNSIFAMRTFDDTGKDFLSNYIGQDYSSELSSMPERHAIFFGRASSCENPVLIALNDRKQFLDVFRRENPIPNKESMCGKVPATSHTAASTASADFDDDIPF